MYVHVAIARTAGCHMHVLTWKLSTAWTSANDNFATQSNARTRLVLLRRRKDCCVQSAHTRRLHRTLLAGQFELCYSCRRAEISFAQWRSQDQNPSSCSSESRCCGACGDGGAWVHRSVPRSKRPKASRGHGWLHVNGVH